MRKSRKPKAKVTTKKTFVLKPLQFFTLASLSSGIPRDCDWIATEVEKRTGFSLTPGLVFGHLHALEDYDFVRAEEKTNTERKLVRVFEITNHGLQYYQECTSKFRAKANSGESS